MSRVRTIEAFPRLSGFSLAARSKIAVVRIFDMSKPRFIAHAEGMWKMKNFISFLFADLAGCVNVSLNLKAILMFMCSGRAVRTRYGWRIFLKVSLDCMFYKIETKDYLLYKISTSKKFSFEGYRRNNDVEKRR